jgi:collagenase-like PrtC family protease
MGISYSIFYIMREIELLAPAKTAEIGIEAINHGADAVYIGAPQFSARAAAGNEVVDIARLVAYSHRFHAKVYVALNTILTDAELPLAERIAWQLYEAGADALIIQDMGLPELSLPPIALHASTQTDNRTVEKVQFLENAGFSQIVLARELSLEQIRTIASQTSAKIECFVHGALCVSYSGQCYASQALRGRSANRGECAQLCRLPYRLEDAEGKVLRAESHFLSLKDLDLSAHLAALMDAGVSSFKIEGRLKEMSYVKNVTAWYRQHLDRLLDGSDRYSKSSPGKVQLFFKPDPQRTFHRGATDYFFDQRNRGLVQLQTPKSIGQLVGQVKKVEHSTLTVKTTDELHNGDGLCFVTSDGIFTGFRVNRVEGERVFPFKMPSVKTGTMLYRNFDQSFEELLTKKSAERTLPLHLLFYETEDGFAINANIESLSPITLHFPYEKELSKSDLAATEQNIEKQFGKLGDTTFSLSGMQVKLSNHWFIPSSLLSTWRRTMVGQLEKTLIVQQDHVQSQHSTKEPRLYPKTRLSYSGNVSNEKARMFYERHGVTSIDPSLETGGQLLPEEPVMTTKYCLKFELGWCPKQKPQTSLHEPLFLTGAHDRFQLYFDCAMCEMQLMIAKK